MAELKVKVSIERASVDSLLSDISALENKTVKIKFEALGLDDVTKDSIRFINAQAEIEKATAKRAAADAKAANLVKIEQDKTAKAHSNAAHYADNLNSAYNRLGVTMANFVKAEFFRAISSGVNDSINDMHRLNDELVTIRKVSNATEDELDAISKRSYEIGAKYGRSPGDYASGVAEFNRAGYRETAEDLAELSIKTQLVGDMSAKTANQFLLATDAAYQYNGSVIKLSSVLDGMNAIDNNYATSIEKMAAGLGKIAPIASQAHVGIDELTAALGTITAVTQRSGEEASTALRALFLNIMGDTKTEIEDGATWTAGEIEGLRDIMRQYIPDIINEADRLGEVINPMEAIGALSQAYKDGLINEQELMQQVTDIGGKLRSSQLLTLIKNWDMYESMLSTYRSAAGSADAEITNMLDSWSVKSEQLSTSFTKLMSNFFNDDTAMNGLDALIGIVDALDSDFGRAAISAGLLATGLAGLSKVSSTLVSVLKNLGTGGWIAIAIAAFGALYGIIDQIVVDYDDLLEKSKESQEAYKKEKSELDAINSELETTNTRIAELQSKGSLSLVEQEELDRLTAATKELEKQQEIKEKQALEAQKEAAYDAAKVAEEYAAYDSSSDVEWIFGKTGKSAGAYDRNINALIDYMDKANELYGDGTLDVTQYNDAIADQEKRVLAVTSALNDFLVQNKEYYDYITSEDNYPSATSDDLFFLEQYEKAKDITEKIEEIWYPETFSKENLDTQSKAKEYVDNYVSSLEFGSEELIKYASAYGEMQERLGEVQGYDTAIALARELGQTYGLSAEGVSSLIQEIRILASQRNGLGETFFPSQKDGSEAGAGNSAKETASQYYSLAKATEEATERYNVLREAMAEIEDIGRVTEGTLDNLIKAGIELGEVFQDDVAGGFWVSKDKIQAAGEETASLLNDLTGSDYSFELDASGVTEFTSALNAAVSALSALKQKLSEMGESGDTFRDFISAYDDAMGLLGEGRTGTNAFSGFTGAILSDEALAEAGSDARARGEMLSNDFISGFIEAGRQGGPQLLEYLSGNFEKMGGEGASFFKDMNGEYQAVIQDFEALSRSTGLSEDVWASAMGMVSEYSNVVSDFGKHAKDTASNVDELAEATSNVATSTEAASNSTQESNVIEVEADTDEAQGDIDELSQSAATLGGDHPVNFSTNAASATAEVAGLQGLVNSVAGEHTISFKVSFADGLSFFAEGTKSAKDGPAIVNEEGPELIVSRGRAFIAGDGKPTIVDLDAGDIVYTHEETKELLAGRSIGKEGIASHKAGTNLKDASLYEKNGGKTIFTTTVPSSDTGSKPKKKNNSNNKPEQSYDDGGNSGGQSQNNDPGIDKDSWKIIEEHYGYLTDKQKRAIDRLSYQIDLLENDLDDLSKPIEKESEQLERLNDQLGRQIELLERQKESAIEPLRKQVDEMREAKDIQDDQLELAERQKAVEEARNELQNAQNERTIRYFNAQKGQWEWMADQGRVSDAEEALKDAEKNLEDYEYDMRIKELENQIEHIEDTYQDRIDEIEDEQLVNNDRIYDLEQKLLALEDAYKTAIEPYETKMTELERQLDAFEEQWAEAEIPYNMPEGDLEKALENLGGEAADRDVVSALISSLKTGAEGNFSSVASASPKTVSVAATRTTNDVYNEILSEMGVLLGASSESAGSTSYTNSSNTNTVYDYSGSVSIGSLTVAADPKTTTLADLIEDVGIYVQN